MIRYEDYDFVKEILDSEGCIILPIEISQYSDGKTDILVYPFCDEIAKEFELRFALDPFSHEAVDFLYKKLTPIVSELGYSTAGADKHTYCEYRCDSADHSKILPECVIIDSLDGEKWEDLELDGFELDASITTDRMAVIRDDGKIVCYAGLNDISEEDGLYEITVECDENYRRRGYAASCVAKLTEYLLSLGEGVKYVCAEDHEVSGKTAESAGYGLFRRVLPFVCVRSDENTETDE